MNKSKDTIFSRSIVCVALSLTLAACGGGGGSDSATPAPIPAPNAAPPPPPPPAGPTVEYHSPQTQQSTGGESCGGATAVPDRGFNDISQSAGLCYDIEVDAEDSVAARVAGGIAVGDVNQDGRLDFYVTHGRNMPGKLFLLQEDGSFSDNTETAGINIIDTDHSAAFVDVDGDTISDLLSIQEGPDSYLQVFKNDGTGNFRDISDQVSIDMSKVAYSVAAGDTDLDGDLDLYFAHWKPDGEQDRWEFLWENEGPGQYKDVSDIVDVGLFEAGQTEGMEDEYSFTPIFADVNSDRFPDLLVASDWNTSQIIMNNGGTDFVDTTPNIVSDRAGMGGTVADYDNDGDLDWYVSAIGDPREEFLTIGLFDGARLYQNDGDGNFSDATDEAGVRQSFWGWGTCFADFNNDGFEDLFVVNGFEGMAEEQAIKGNFDLFKDDPAILYVNNKDGTFERMDASTGIDHVAMGRGLVCYDYDRDGDLDIVVANNGVSPTLYRNDQFASSGNFINIRLKGLAENPEAVGARIYVQAGELSMMRELQLGNHYVSQNPVEAHFGIADVTTISEIRIVWPGLEGEESIITDVDANQFMMVHHPDL